MIRYPNCIKSLTMFLLVAGLAAALTAGLSAHCDTLGGPVIPDARAALAKGDLTPVLKWVTPAQEAELRAAFDRCRAVRDKGPAAVELAEQYFLETAVRLHRASEGAPFTGLKPAGAMEPMEVRADEALKAGSIDEVVKRVTERVAANIRERFEKVLERKKHADESVEAGRAYVAAYVDYLHYLMGLHQAVSGGAHHQEHAE